MSIRLFKPGDAEAVSALIGETMRTSNSDDYPLDRLQPLIDYFSPGKVTELAQERHCLVAELGCEVVGTISLDGLGETCAELYTFFVHPEHQGMGLGSWLLQAAEDAAGGDGTSIIRIAASKTGVQFYQHRGYERNGMDIEGTAGLQIGMEKMLTGIPSSERRQV